MPDKKLHEIPDANLPLDGDEFLLVDQNGLSRKITIDDLPSGGGGGDVASVNGQTGVVVLDAADVGAVADGTLADVATSGDYSDLINLPDLKDFAFIDKNSEGGLTLNPDRLGLSEPLNNEFPFVHQFHTNVTPGEDMVNELTTLFSNRLQLNGDFQYGQQSGGGLVLIDNRIVHQGTSELGRATIFQNTVELNGAGSHTPGVNVNDTSVIMRNGSTAQFVAPVSSFITLEENCHADTVNLYNSNLIVNDDATIDFALTANYSVQVNDGGTINNLNGIRAHYTNYFGGTGTLTGGTEGFQIGVFGDLELESFRGSSVTYGPTGATNGFTGFDVYIDPNAGTIQQATGVNISMGNYDTTLFRRTAINCNAGSINQFHSISTNSNIFFDSSNTLYNEFKTVSGNPITGTEMLMTLFSTQMTFEDDMETGPLGLGLVGLGSVGNIDIANGVVVERIAMLIAAQAIGAVSDNGTVDEFSCYKAGGLLNFGMGGTLQANKTISFLGEYFGGAQVGTERWGLVVRDPEAENYMSKSLVIGGNTEKVTNDDIGIEIADKKALKLTPMDIAERDALTASIGMIVHIVDGPTNEIQFYNGSSWSAV
jgi:hypothetical protein